MKLLRPATLLFVSALLPSCYYVQPSKDSPHAVVDFQEGSGFLNLKGVNFVPVSINDRRPENWVPGNNTENRYRITPGATEIATYIYGDESNRRGATVLRFDAKTGGTYDITAKDGRDHFDVAVTEQNGGSVLKRKVDKVFYTNPQPMIYVPVPAN